MAPPAVQNVMEFSAAALRPDGALIMQSESTCCIIQIEAVLT